MLLAASCLAVAGLVAAQELPRLPADMTMEQSGDSPGKVVFSHASHVGMQAKPDCTSCHPKLAPILKAKASSRKPITHEAMLKGQSCGSCHNGDDARGFDDCTMCHRGQ
jgi:c(7)-type cytochrome triheme protein